MSKAYRRKDPFYAIVAKNRPTYDVFSDGTKSFDSNSSDSVPTDTNVNKKPKKPTNKRLINVNIKSFSINFVQYLGS